MTSIQEIDRAISAHGMWKLHLKSAIATGVMDESVDSIRVDDRCTFGQWLHGPTLSTADKASSQYLAVKALHGEFHRTAARVAELAVGGRKAEAEQMMALGGEFASISSKLTLAMMEWKRSAR